MFFIDKLFNKNTNNDSEDSNINNENLPNEIKDQKKEGNFLISENINNITNNSIDNLITNSNLNFQLGVKMVEDKINEEIENTNIYNSNTNNTTTKLCHSDFLGNIPSNNISNNHNSNSNTNTINNINTINNTNTNTNSYINYNNISYDKYNINNLILGPFHIFKAKVETADRMTGKLRDKDLFKYFLYRNMTDTQRMIYKEIYLKYTNKLNREIDYNEYNSNKSNINNKLKKNINRFIDNTSSNISDTNCNISDSNKRIKRYYNDKSILLYDNIFNNTSSMLSTPPVIEYIPKKCRPKIIKNRAAIEIGKKNKINSNIIVNDNDNILFSKTPYLLWLDSMVNQYLKRFNTLYTDRCITEVEIERKVFQVALELGIEWQKMSIKEKRDWVRVKKDEIAKEENKKYDIGDI